MCGTKDDLLSFTLIPPGCLDWAGQQEPDPAFQSAQKLVLGETDSVREQQAGCELGGASWTECEAL